MNAFFITLIAVAILLLTAAPGFVFVKKKMLGERCTSDFSKVLLYICQPCLAVYTFASASFSVQMLRDIGFFLIATVLIHGVMLAGSFLVLRKKFKDAAYRILTISTAFANCAFFGIPIIEALMPEKAGGLIIYTTIYALIMNLLGWTVGSAIISGDAKYISVKKLFLNPTFIGVAIGFPMFVFSLSMPDKLFDMISILGKMTTPLSMLIMGMRLATTEFKTVFLSVRTYFAIMAKGFLMPLIGLLTVYFIPLPVDVKATFFIICACPTASIVLNFSELIGEGQKDAAASVLLSTISSIVTLPIMVLLLPLL